jgi:hypothetical protein
VTLSPSAFQSVSGKFVTLAGAVASRQAGVTVTIRAEPFGSGSLKTLGTALTGAGGVWTYQARPKIATTYQASSSDGASAPVTIGVHPAVSLRVITKARFSTHVAAAKPFPGKIVQLQIRLPDGRWKTVARSRLNTRSSAVFAAAKLPRGTSTVRVAMSVNQAGPGFLGGFSRLLTYKRR